MLKWQQNKAQQKRLHIVWDISYHMLHAVTCGVLCQKQVSRAGSSNYIAQHLWDVITCCCPWYILPAQHYPLLSVMPDDSRRSYLIFHPVRLLRINRIFFAEMIFLWRKPFLTRVSISFGNKLYMQKWNMHIRRGKWNIPCRHGINQLWMLIYASWKRKR